MVDFFVDFNKSYGTTQVSNMEESWVGSGLVWRALTLQDRRFSNGFAKLLMDNLGVKKLTVSYLYLPLWLHCRGHHRQTRPSRAGQSGAAQRPT